ncbi:BING4CT domain protein [Dictyocaulus viviparus]|uniref:BING4CT domain protein n=1 Tax=Dictyocaulus viviparus TaxID=29172 RepID=A0A0D8XU83_DICVI|nr:BING4CT domain protein [Dictyocaulus viviparus]
MAPNQTLKSILNGKWSSEDQLKHSRSKTFPIKDASSLNPHNMRSEFHREKFTLEKNRLVQRCMKTARAEILNAENEGVIEADDGEHTYTIRQKEIADSVDLANASKASYFRFFFELHLENYGPYRISYTDNGRHLLLGGKKGHVATMDWQLKKLHCEINVMEIVRDVQWMHTENIYAVAQRHYTYVYDNQGTEIHCVKQLHKIRRLQFLPRHFLLVASSDTGWLHWLDVSVGKIVTSFPARMGSLGVMCQNPGNAIIHTGHDNGTVCMWSPNVKEPLVKILAHHASIRGMDIEQTGKYMVTTGLDLKCRVWDIRMYKQLHAYSLAFGLSHVAISQRLSIACAIGNSVQIFNNMHLGVCYEPYLIHNFGGSVHDLSFVPYEDVLGVGHVAGFTSMLVPGSGEPNVDAMRSNPYETKQQRREREVKQLLDKLQPELIALDPQDIVRVNENQLEKQMEERKKILYIRPVNIKYTPRHKMRGRGTGLHKEYRKKVVISQRRKERNNEKKEVEEEVFGKTEQKTSASTHVLERFRS